MIEYIQVLGVAADGKSPEGSGAGLQGQGVVESDQAELQLNLNHWPPAYLLVPREDFF